MTQEKTNDEKFIELLGYKFNSARDSLITFNESLPVVNYNDGIYSIEGSGTTSGSFVYIIREYLGRELSVLEAKAAIENEKINAIKSIMSLDSGIDCEIVAYGLHFKLMKMRSNCIQYRRYYLIGTEYHFRNEIDCDYELNVDEGVYLEENLYIYGKVLYSLCLSSDHRGPQKETPEEAISSMINSFYKESKFRYNFISELIKKIDGFELEET
jgi:hypothetical protein